MELLLILPIFLCRLLWEHHMERVAEDYAKRYDPR